jgi:hypothetical protein
MRKGAAAARPLSIHSGLRRCEKRPLDAKEANSTDRGRVTAAISASGRICPLGVSQRYTREAL